MPDRSPDDSRPDVFERSLDDMLERVSASTRAEQAARTAGDVPAAKRAPPPPAPVASKAEASAPAADRGTHRRAAGGIAALLAIGVGAAGLWTHAWQPAIERPQGAYETLPPTSAGAAPPPAASVAAAAARASLPDVGLDRDASTESTMLDQLEPLAREAPGETAPAVVARAAPAIAIARYDTLRAAPPAWRVLAPLNVEEVYALVPATSPLRDMDALRGRRINVGEPGSARAISGEALYRALFSEPLPASRWRSASRQAALQQLTGGDGLDAMIFFDGQPSAWLESLPAPTRERLKLLRVDATRVAGRRALQAYLPATIAPPLAHGREPVPTLGEVVFLVASPQAPGAPSLMQALCDRLPGLKARGHAKWKEIDLSLRLPAPLQRVSETEPASHACRPSTSRDPPGPSPSGAPP